MRFLILLTIPLFGCPHPSRARQWIAADRGALLAAITWEKDTPELVYVTSGANGFEVKPGQLGHCAPKRLDQPIGVFGGPSPLIKLLEPDYHACRDGTPVTKLGGQRAIHSFAGGYFWLDVRTDGVFVVAAGAEEAQLWEAKLPPAPECPTDALSAWKLHVSPAGAWMAVTSSFRCGQEARLRITLLDEKGGVRASGEEVLSHGTSYSTAIRDDGTLLALVAEKDKTKSTALFLAPDATIGKLEGLPVGEVLGALGQLWLLQQDVLVVWHEERGPVIEHRVKIKTAAVASDRALLLVGDQGRWDVAPRILELDAQGKIVRDEHFDIDKHKPK